MIKKIHSIILISQIVLLTACGGGETGDNRTVKTVDFSHVVATGYTYHRASGNRYVDGMGNIDQLSPIDIALSGEVRWVTGVAQGNSSIWSVVLSNGDVEAFEIRNGAVVKRDIRPENVLPGTVPTMALDANGQVWLANVADDGSLDSSPVIVDKATGSRVYLTSAGEVVLRTGERIQRLNIDAVPYSRIVMDEQKRILVLSKPSTRYDHRVLGSRYPNATAISLLTTQPELELLGNINIAEPDVIEGNPLIWEDVNGDGKQEIIVTLSNANEGARIAVFNEDGTEYGSSSAIGTGFRWRHQVAVAPFRPGGQYLASVYIPHLGPELEFLRLDDASLSRENQAVNYSSHLQISLNLDRSLAGDFDGDGRVEILLLNRDTRDELAAFEYGDTDMRLDWRVSLAGVMSSNLAAVTLADDSIALAMGQGNSLRIWQP